MEAPHLARAAAGGGPAGQLAAVLACVPALETPHSGWGPAWPTRGRAGLVCVLALVSRDAPQLTDSPRPAAPLDWRTFSPPLRAAVDGWQCAGEAFDDVLAVIAAGGEGEEVQLECARASDGALTNLAGRVHLAANAQEEGVTVSDSGLQYKVLENGNGARCTGVGQSCVVHYEGKLVNGTKFDSSYDRGKPATFKPKQVIAGWTEALLLMREGDVWEASLPCELGYGKRGSAPLIAPGDALIFKIELQRVTA